jgi:hypothetical protein
VDFRKNLHGFEIKFFLFLEPRKMPQKKRKRNRLPVDSSSEESSTVSKDSDPDSDREEEVRQEHAPKRSKLLWSESEMQNLQKNYRFLETIQDSILARTPLKDIVKMRGGAKARGARF